MNGRRNMEEKRGDERKEAENERGYGHNAFFCRIGTTKLFYFGGLIWRKQKS